MLKMYCDGALIWETGSDDERYKAKDPVIVDQFRKVPTLSFTIPKTNAMYGQINPIMSRVVVEENGNIIFHGRPLTVEKTFDLREKVMCENTLGFMRDVYQYYSEKIGVSGVENPIEYLYGAILDGTPGHIGYNSLCDAGNTINLGTGYEDATRTEANLRRQNGRSPLDFVLLLSEDYPTAVWMSWAKENGNIVPYLNFAEQALIESVPLTSADDQKIVFGGNLVDLNEDIDTTNVFTQIRGYDTTHSVWFDYSQDAHVAAYGSIKIGKDFDTSGYSEASYGRTQEAKKYYDANAFPVVTRSVKAVDMVDAGVAGINRFRVGFYYDVVSPPHGINERMMCQKITRYLDKPGRSNYEFGQVKRTLTNTLAGR